MKFTTTSISAATVALVASRTTGAHAPGSFCLDGQALRANAPTGPDRYRDAMAPQFESKRAELQASQPQAQGLSAYESFMAWTAWVTAVERANQWLAERSAEAEQQLRWAQAAEALLAVDATPSAPASGAARALGAAQGGGSGVRNPKGTAATQKLAGGSDPMPFTGAADPGDMRGLPAPASMVVWLARWRASAEAAALARAAQAASERLAPRGSRQHPPDSALRHHSPAPERSRSVALAIEHHGADG
jgi:hypothetical protein